MDEEQDDQTAEIPPPIPEQNAEKPTDDWVTGDEPMTGPQASYLETLCREAGEEFDPKLSKADASKRIDELQAKTGRGGDTPKRNDRSSSGARHARRWEDPRWRGAAWTGSSGRTGRTALPVDA